MDQLKEIINIVSKQKIKNFEILTLNATKGKLYELYEGVHNGSFTTDQEAIDVLYEGKQAKESYRKLKGRLIQQLINTTLFISTTPNFNEHQKLHFNCHKNLSAVEILMARGARKTAAMLAKKTLKQSIRLELTYITTQLALKLRSYYGYSGDIKKFEKYNTLFKRFSKMSDAEMIALEYSDHLSALISKSAITDKLIPLAKEYEKELRALSNIEASSKFCTHSYGVFVNRCEFEGDQIGIQKNCEEAIRFLESKEIVNKAYIFFFLFKSLNTYLRFRQFEDGQKAIRKCLQLLSVPKTRNWFLVKEKYILLCLHCAEYEEAELQFLEEISNKALLKIPKVEQEKWEIMKGYFDWLKRTGMLTSTDSKKGEYAFKPGKFLNMVPVYSKDKEGFNAAILILQMLFLLQMKKYDTVIDKVEALKVYAYRYLRKRQSFRTYCFVNMLVAIPAGYFNRIAVQRKAQKWYNKLLSKPLSEFAEIGDVEIVPYEALWEVIQEQLDERIRKSKRAI